MANKRSNKSKSHSKKDGVMSYFGMSNSHTKHGRASSNSRRGGRSSTRCTSCK